MNQQKFGEAALVLARPLDSGSARQRGKSGDASR
jgi:hypothetical protein